MLGPSLVWCRVLQFVGTISSGGHRQFAGMIAHAYPSPATNIELMRHMIIIDSHVGPVR